jgi:hypothetical protein
MYKTGQDVGQEWERWEVHRQSSSEKAMEREYFEDLGADGWQIGPIGAIGLSITLTLYAQNLRHSLRLRQNVALLQSKTTVTLCVTQL